MSNKIKDVILIAIAAGLLIAILVPSRNPSSDEPSASQSFGGTKTDSGQAASEPGSSALLKPLLMETNCSAPANNIAHEFLPIVAGSKWVYRVAGPSEFAPDKTWSMKIKSAPADGAPGTLETGFGDKLDQTSIWLENGAVRLDGLPLVEPIIYLNNRPKAVLGALFPAGGSVVKGAVWNLKYQRDLTHQYRDDRGRLVNLPAKGVQSERAEVEEFEDIIVPAGRFNSYRIFWLSRLEIKAKNRQILDALTGEPYRKEIMWVAAGIGIVRRKIDYAGVRAGRFSFDLVNYTRPEK